MEAEEKLWEVAKEDTIKNWNDEGRHDYWLVISQWLDVEKWMLPHSNDDLINLSRWVLKALAFHRICKHLRSNGHIKTMFIPTISFLLSWSGKSTASNPIDNPPTALEKSRLIISILNLFLFRMLEKNIYGRFSAGTNKQKLCRKLD